MNNLENAFWRDIPIYLTGLLEDPLAFIHILLEHEKHEDYLLIAAKCLVSCNCNPALYKEEVDKIIEKHLIESIQNDRYTKDAVEIVRTLGEDAIQLLLAHLDNSSEIIEVRALTGDEVVERKWRKYGRIIYILGELNTGLLVDKLRRVFMQVKDIHLLYHIVIALYTLKNEGAIELLRDDYLRTHFDPVVRTFSTLAGLRVAPQDDDLIRDSKELIEALTNNIRNQDEMEFALRAHSAEALGLLGMQEAIAPLAELLKNEIRMEPQTSAIKALGYIATKHRLPEINVKIIDALIDSVELGGVYNNKWGKKLIKELFILLCSEGDIQKLNDAITRINKSESNETVKQNKREIFDEVINARQTRK
jgi:hypothetical protein